MFLNYIAGTVSLILAVSTFIPWITVWFYSLKGVESMYGLLTLVVGLMGVTLSVFQYLSGKARGRGYVGFSIVALACETLYFRKMAAVGEKINEVINLAVSLLGDTIQQKIQQLIGEQWTKVLSVLAQQVGTRTSVNSFDFLGSGLVLAVVSAISLLAVGILMESKKPKEE